MRAVLTSLALLLFTSSAVAGETAKTWVDGRFYLTEPALYTATRSEIGASFRDVLPWGTVVELYYGFGVQDLKSPTPLINDWNDTGRVKATPDGPYTWTAWVDKPLHERGDDTRRSRFQFIWVITTPDGHRYYERGSTTALGFFEAKLPEPATVQAIGREHAPYRRLDVYVVHRQN